MECLCPFRGRSVRLSKIESTLRTGDIVLFSGTAASSWLIQFGTCSPYSHVGMIVRSRGALYLWHAPGQSLHSFHDVFSNKNPGGPHLNTLRPLLKAAAGRCYLSRLKGEPFDDPRDTPLWDFMREAAKRPYERSTRDLVLSAYDGPFGRNRPDPSSYFCSELIAETYERMGIVASDEPADEYVPGDFSAQNAVHWLDDGYRLTTEKRLVV